MSRSKQRFYVRCRGRQLGPLSIRQLELMERRGELSGSDEVSEDRVNWGPLEGLEEIFPPPREEVSQPEPVTSPGPQKPTGGPPPQRPRRRRPFRQPVRPVLPAPVGPGYTGTTEVGTSVVGPGSSGSSSVVPGSTLSTYHAVAAVAGCLILVVGWVALSSTGDAKGQNSSALAESEADADSTTMIRSYSRKTEDGEFVVGISSEALDSIRQEQVGQNWCWAACIQMLLRAHGFDRTQTEIVQRTFGDSRDQGARNLEEIARNLEGWPLSRNGQPYVLSCEITKYAPGLGYMIEQLKQGRPLIIAYDHPGGGHAVVITAVKYRKYSSGQPGISEIVVRDPSELDSRTRGRRVFQPEEYRNCRGSVYVIPVE